MARCCKATALRALEMQGGKRQDQTPGPFAARIGVPLDTVRNWEQGKRSPAGPARVLLKVLDRAPKMTLAALE